MSYFIDGLTTTIRIVSLIGAAILGLMLTVTILAG